MMAGPQRGVPQALPRDALLQPGPLHEAPRARGRARHRRPRRSTRVRRFGEDVLGKGIVFGKDTPNFVGNRIGAHAMMTTIHLMLEEGLSPEDVDAITGDADGPPEERELPHRRTSSASTRSCTSPTTATRRSRTTRTARSSRCPPTSGRWSRRSSSATRPRAASTARARTAPIETLDPKTLEYRAQGRRRGDQKATARSSARSRTRASACGSSSPTPGKAGAVRVEGALAIARVLGAPHRRDRRRRRRDR